MLNQAGNLEHLEFDQSGWLTEESAFSVPAEGANGWGEISFASIQRFVGPVFDTCYAPARSCSKSLSDSLQQMPIPGTQQSVVPHLHEPLWQHVLQESPHEFFRAHRAESRLSAQHRRA